jgi:hypothetical protein
MEEDEILGDETLEDEKQNIQKNVEKELFYEQSKILDRFYSAVCRFFGKITNFKKLLGRKFHIERSIFSIYYTKLDFKFTANSRHCLLSLMTLAFAAAGVSFTVLTFMFGRGGTNIQEALHSYHINFCFFVYSRLF